MSPSFERVKDYLERGDKLEAIKVLEEIAQVRAIASRYRLQAWHFLREAGARPPSHLERDVLGVVVEVGMDSGHDLLAVYADKTAHYYNYSGAGVVWEHPDSSLDKLIEAVLKGHLRLNILTPSGLYFGEGPFEDLDRDPRARPLIHAALDLMRRLTSLVVPG